MPKQSTGYSIKFGFNVKHSPKDLAQIYLFIRLNKSVKKRKLPIRLIRDRWDDKVKMPKKSWAKENPELWQYLDQMRSKFSELSIRLDSGKCTIENAFNELLNRTEIKSCMDFLESDLASYPPLELRKHKDRVKSIEMHMGKGYTPLMFDHLQDPNSVTLIAKTLKGNPDLKNNTVRDYMSSLDSISKKAKLSNPKPFGSDHKPPRQSTKKRVVTQMDLYEGVSKISSPIEFISFGIWLYAFSLRGMTGADIPNISEDDVLADYTHAYYPNHQSSEVYDAYRTKCHLQKQRGKSGEYYTILLNLFPSFHIHKILKELMPKYWSHYAYKGSDKLRLFNFKTKIKWTAEDIQGGIQWKQMNDTIRDNLKKTIGEGIHATRHTFSSIASQKLRLSDRELKELLAHSGGEAIDSYTEEAQAKTDLSHVFVLQEFDLIKAFHLWYQKGIKGLVITKAKGLEPLFDDYLSNLDKGILERGKLTSWSYEEELRLEKLLVDHLERKDPYLDEDGEVKYKIKQPTKELEDLLIKKRIEWDAETTDLLLLNQDSMEPLHEPKLSKNERKLAEYLASKELSPE